MPEQQPRKPKVKAVAISSRVRAELVAVVRRETAELEARIVERIEVLTGRVYDMQDLIKHVAQLCKAVEDAHLRAAQADARVAALEAHIRAHGLQVV